MTDNEQRILAAIARLHNAPVSEWPSGEVDRYICTLETVAEHELNSGEIELLFEAYNATNDALESLAARGPLSWELAYLASDHYYMGSPISLTH